MPSGPEPASGPAAPDSPRALAAEVVAFCRAQGFALAGVCAAEPTARGGEFDAWIAAGKHGDMSWLASSAAKRKDPALELPGARSIIMVADRYADGTPDPPPPVDAQGQPIAWGKIARYARGRDYHWFIKRRLHALNDALRVRFPGHQFRTFVDSAPVLEREFAARAGIGWIGKHTLVLNQREGSYLLLGGTLTTLELEPSRPMVSGAQAGGAGGGDDSPCGTCTRCIDACPTQAITPFSVDARRCISYLTIETEAPIDPALRSGLSGWLFGCDICQEVCPFNAPTAGRVSAASTVNPAYAARRTGTGLPLAEVLGWDEEQKRRAVEGMAVKRASLELLQRTARDLLFNLSGVGVERRGKEG